MSCIDELISKLCSNGVEYKRLGDVGEFIRGNGLQKSDLTESGVGAIHYGQIHTIYGVWTDATKSFVNEEFASRLRKARPGDLVIATTSEDDGAVSKAVAWIGKEDIAVSGDAYIFRHSLEPKYVAYFFKTENFQMQKRPHITGTKVRRISGENLAKIRIPVPPLEVQREIVKILDNFTQLEAELEAELEARRRQYKYYRDALLTFGEPEASKQASVRWMTLGEVGRLVRGNGMPKSDFSESGVGCIHYGQIYTFFGTWTDRVISSVPAEKAERLTKVDPGDLVITNTSENVLDVCKAVAWMGDNQIVTGGHASVLKHQQNPKYLSYYMQTKAFEREKRKFAAGTKVIDVSASNLAKIRIPVPPLEEQERIVAILDKFDALVNDISTGLPAEIKARRQQYEYYRDRLLTFKEAA